jgi:signal transduction histidine kinase
MNANIFTLIPDRCKFDTFWVEVRKRNRWLIILRYFAIFMLASLTAGIEWLKATRNNIDFDTNPLWLIAFSILVYNILFHYLWNYLSIKRNWNYKTKITYPRRGFHSLHFSLIQICIDFIALMLFIYFTGGVETPLFGFFIFHVIIGSMLLPGSVMTLIITITMSVSATGAILEFHKIIPHYAIKGIMPYTLYNDYMYIAIFFTLFGIVLYMSIYLANSISKQLYRRERALTIAYEKLEEAEKSKSRYVMSVVHDLKTPIAAVLTYLDMLLEGSKGELKEGQVQPLERSKIRLLNAIGIINDILYISQLKLESTIDKSTNVNLNELFEEIYHDFQVIIHSKNISYEFHSDHEQSIIKGEARILKLALANIISNSVKYSDNNGKIRIKITDYRNSYLISVADSGIGIPDTEKRKVFDDFYRTTKSKKRSTEGSGLGLSITLETIRKYSGSIKVESPSYLAVSDDLPGSEFIIELPKE